MKRSKLHCVIPTVFLALVCLAWMFTTGCSQPTPTISESRGVSVEKPGSKPARAQTINLGESKKTEVSSLEGGLEIIVNGVSTGVTTPSRVNLEPGDLVTLSSTVRPGIEVLLVTEGEQMQNGAWVVQGDEKLLLFSSKPVAHGNQKLIDTGWEWRTIGIDLNKNVPDETFNSLADSAKPFRVLYADRRTGLSGQLLSALTDLWVLDLSAGDVADLQFAKNLLQLRMLSLIGTKVTDLAPLRPLDQMRVLDLDRTGVTDLTPLSTMSQLRRLGLRETGVGSLAALSDMRSLVVLDLVSTKVSDLSPLPVLEGLRELYLSRTQVASIEPASRFTGLDILHLSETPIADLSGFAALKKLRILHLDLTNVNDLAPLAGLDQLVQLTLNGSKVADVSVLGGLTGLVKLNLAGTPVTDLAPLASLKNLQWLSLWGAKTTDEDVKWLKAQLPDCKIIYGQPKASSR